MPKSSSMRSPRKRHATDPKTPAPAIVSIVPQPDQELSFDMIKAPLFRGIHADGVWGGITPQGLFSLTFFGERFPIPEHVSHKVAPGQTLGEEIPEKRVSRSSIVRELEVCVYMAPHTARAFHEFLGQQLQQFQNSPFNGGSTSGK